MMRFNATFFCMIPWITFAIAWVVSGFERSVIRDIAVIWFMLSPPYVGIALGIAYVEGKRSKK